VSVVKSVVDGLTLVSKIGVFDSRDEVIESEMAYVPLICARE